MPKLAGVNHLDAVRAFQKAVGVACGEAELRGYSAPAELATEEQRDGTGDSSHGEILTNSATDQARMSAIGVAPRSVSGIGLPTLDMFSFVGSMPRAVTMVDSRSGTLTGLSATFSPPSSVFP